jgi:hypothetical protein
MTSGFLPGTYERCMSGHYYPVVRGDEECSTCAQLADRDAHIAELKKVLRLMVDSAVPHPVEHPTMTAAWKVARAALADPPATESDCGKNLLEDRRPSNGRA